MDAILKNVQKEGRVHLNLLSIGMPSCMLDVVVGAGPPDDIPPDDYMVLATTRFKFNEPTWVVRVTSEPQLYYFVVAKPVWQPHLKNDHVKTYVPDMNALSDDYMVLAHKDAT